MVSRSRSGRLKSPAGPLLPYVEYRPSDTKPGCWPRLDFILRKGVCRTTVYPLHHFLFPRTFQADFVVGLFHMRELVVYANSGPAELLNSTDSGGETPYKVRGIQEQCFRQWTV